MWNDPGSPWHAQTGGPLLCAYRFLYGAERVRERIDIMWEEEKCFAGQLSKKCLIHYFPFKAGAARRASSRHVTVLGPADSLTLAGRDLQRAGQWLVDRGHCERCVCMCVGRGGWGCALLESYIQLKPGPGFSLEMCTFERQEGGAGAGRPLLYTASATFSLNIFHLNSCKCGKLRVLNMTGVYRIEPSYRHSPL